MYLRNNAAALSVEMQSDRFRQTESGFVFTILIDENHYTIYQGK